MGTLSSQYPNSNAVEAALDRANSAAHDVSILNTEMTDVLARLDALEYVPVKINSFTASPTTCEMGSSNSINLSWSLSKAANLTINGTAVTGSSYTATGVTSNQTFTLAATDGTTTDSKSVSVGFANQIYWGAASDTSAVASLSNKTLSNTKSRTITVNATSGKYIIYALPKRLGTVTFKVNGFDGGFSSPEEKNITNASGYTEAYYVYKSTNANLGNTTVVIS